MSRLGVDFKGLDVMLMLLMWQDTLWADTRERGGRGKMAGIAM